MNLLLANGHPEAARYPIGRIYDEARMVVERRNTELATLGVIIQSAALSTGMGASKESAQHFQKLIASLSGEL